jgi:hypothetical protein
MTKLLAILIALVACACSGPIGLGTPANLTETVCVVPSAGVTVEDIADAAAVWHASDARVNMTVRAMADGPQSECDTVVSAEKQGYPCAATTMTGEHIYLDLHDGCDLRTVEPHELGHLLLGGDHSDRPRRPHVLRVRRLLSVARRSFTTQHDRQPIGHTCNKLECLDHQSPTTSTALRLLCRR